MMKTSHNVLSGGEKNFQANDLEELALMRLVALGDTQAFEILYRAYMPRLQRYLSTQGRIASVIDDVCQDVMLVMWQQAAQFRAEARVSTWIFRIAQRQAWKRSTQEGHPVTEIDATDVGGDEPEGVLHDKAQNAAVARAVAALPPTLRLTMTLKYYHHYSHRQIAQHMRCTEDTVMRRLRQARRRLSSSLRRTHLARASVA